MEKAVLTIKGSFNGIKGDFFKNLAIMLSIIIIFVIGKSIKTQYFIAYNIQSFVIFVAELKHMAVITIIYLISILQVLLLLISLKTSYKVIKLFYEIKKVTVFDFSLGKITSTYYSFPLVKKVEEYKFHEIVNINISQGYMNRLFSTGNLHIEYLSFNNLDSQVRVLDVPCVEEPFKLKPYMLHEKD